MKHIIQPELMKVLRGSLPLAIANISLALSPVIDSIMLGHFSQVDQAAAGVGLQIYLLMLILGEGLIFGFSPRYGKFKFDTPNHKRLTANTIAILLLIAAVAVFGAIAALTFTKLSFLLLDSDSLGAKSTAYVSILMVALPLNLLLLLHWEILTANEHGRIISMISWSVIVLNACMNYIFIFGKAGLPPQGIVGAGIATALSSFMGVAAAFIYCRMKNISLLGSAKPSLLEIRSEAIQIVKYGLPISLSTGITVGFISVSIFFMEKVGISQLSGYLINLQLVELLVLACLGFGECLALYLAKNRRFLNTEDVILLTKQLLLICSSATALLLTLFWAFRVPITSIYLGLNSEHQPTVRFFSDYLVITIIFVWADIYLILTSGVLRGLENTLLPLRFNLIGLWIVGLTVMLVIYRAWPESHIGVAFALQVGFTFAAFLMLFEFRRALEKAFQHYPSHQQ